MSPARYPDWHHVETLVEAGNPVVFNLIGEPALLIRFTAQPPTLALEVAGVRSARKLPETPDAITVQRIAADPAPALLISTTITEVFAPFYAMITGIADDVQLGGTKAEDALADALEGWKRLLLVEPATSAAAQAGLFGELLIVLAHVRTRGAGALAAWVGPLKEPHDLRLPHVDLEVKTTSQERRAHVISSLGQLVAVPGRPLYLVSIGVQEAPDAAGARSVADLVGELREIVEDDASHASRLRRLLRECGWREGGPAEPARFILRHLPALMEVGPTSPRIVPEHIVASIGAAHAARIDRVQYTLDVTDLVVPIQDSPLADLFDLGTFDAHL